MLQKNFLDFNLSERIGYADASRNLEHTEFGEFEINQAQQLSELETETKLSLADPDIETVAVYTLTSDGSA